MINIHSVNGYMRLNSWVFANILQLGTQAFCKRFVDFKIDPCGRLRDQMEMAARAVPANIAEGSSRHQTSYETEMRLLDVARASVSELEGDYLNWLMRSHQNAWCTDAPQHKQLIAIQLEPANYGQNLSNDVTTHILKQYARFAHFVEGVDSFAAANAMIILCQRVKQLLTAQINRQLGDFKQTGGFTENMTQERIATIKENASNNENPKCPKCGAIMRKMVAKKGRNAGNEFWGCTDFPNCTGTRQL